MINFKDIKQKDINRFFNHVKIGISGECDKWMAYKNRQGYGFIKFNGKTYLAHRFAWMIYHKQNIPKGMVIMHKCDNPSCVSENCLQLGTIALNNEDKLIKGRGNWSQEVRLKIRNANLGKHASEKTKEKMRISHKGKKLNFKKKNLKCKNCNKDFIGIVNKQLFCCKKCQSKHYSNNHIRKKLNLKCKNCNNEFNGFRNQLFCCRKCQYKFAYIIKKNKINIL